MSPFHISTNDIPIESIHALIDTIQDFLCKLGMKPRMYAAIGNHHFFTKTIIKGLCKAS